MAQRPLFVSQKHDPFTENDFDLCTMACGAMALDYHTQGRVRMRGGQLVDKAGLEPKDIEDGTNLGDVSRAWARVAKERKDPSIVLQVRRNTGWSDVQEALANGRAVILQGNYNVLSDKFTCQPGTMKGNGGHAMLLLPERSNGRIMVGDPLCEPDMGFRLIPETELRKFAEKFSSPSNVLHANTRAFPPSAKSVAPPPAARSAAPPAKAPPAPQSAPPPAGLDPTFDRPVAMCDVTGPTDLFDDPAGARTLVAGWRGAQDVGLYARPRAGGPHVLAAIRIDTVKGPGEKLRIAWVPDSAVTNVRLVPS